jgi:hypothetical protein
MAKGGYTVEISGIEETTNAIAGVQEDLAPGGKLTDTARDTANGLATELRSSAGAAATPVASRVAQSIQVKGGNLPAVAIGGGMPVGRYGGRAAALVWGSEHGGRNFAAAAGGAYWIKPGVESYRPKALDRFEVSVHGIIVGRGL